VTEAKRRILVVDDQPDVLEALRLLLKGHGYSTEMALSPEHALKASERTGHDMVLIDMNYARDTTSGTEGLALLDTLHARRPEVPVVVMTAWSTIDLAVEAMRRGASDFITKPWENDRVLRVLEKQSAKPRELSLARRIQRRLLPPDHFTGPGIECDCVFRPAGELGGDLCDVLSTGPSSTAFLLGDISGKGAGAALLMAHLHATIRSNLDLASTPALLMARANRLFFQSTEPEHYATLFFAVFDAENRILRYVNCGHPSPILLRKDGTIVRLDSTSLMLGAFESSAFEERGIDVSPGDRLVVFSDGVSEAHDTETDAWVVECVRRNESLSMAAAMSEDDVTVLDLRFV
jgi:sigma-B regulation protein RsbU (phosphoserine phosphatase)